MEFGHTQKHAHRRTVLLIIATMALATALAVTIQSVALQGAVSGYSSSVRVKQIDRYQSECKECTDKYFACMSQMRRRRDYSDEKLALFSRTCSDSYKNCRNREQCFN